MGPNDHTNIRISYSGWKAQYDQRDTRNPVLQDPDVYVVFSGPIADGSLSRIAFFIASKACRIHRGQKASVPKRWSMSSSLANEGSWDLVTVGSRQNTEGPLKGIIDMRQV